MAKYSKRFLSLMLAALLVLGLFPMGVLASEAGTGNFLSGLEFRTGTKTSANLLTTFDAATRAYSLEAAQTTSTFWMTITLSGDAPKDSVIKVEYLKADNSSASAVFTSGTAKSAALGGKMGNRVTPLTITVGVEGNEQVYTITVNPKKTGYLSVLTMASSVGGENLLPGFDSDTLVYNVSVAPGTDKLYFVTQPHSVNAPQATVTVGEAVVQRTGTNAMLNNAGKYEAVIGQTTAVTADGSTVTCLELSQAITNKAMLLLVTATNGNKTNKYVLHLNPAPAHADPKDAFAGSGTEANPYIISSQEQLTEFALMVNGGNSFAGLTVKLGADLTLPSDWTPIGVCTDTTLTVAKGLNAFSGIFDGDGHTVTVPKDGLPLFGYICNTTIKNLKIYGEQINGYGLINNFEGVSLTSVSTIDNVTLLSGTKTLKSGLVGANITTNGWAGNSPSSIVNISNCTVESGVVIGYDETQSNIGSICGLLQGTVTNCVSDATVKGVKYVGGLVGSRDNAMGEVSISGCTFSGTVTGTEFVGGIVGGGYNTANDAPNGGKVSLIGNKVTGTVTGTDCVGGICGGDPYVVQIWENVTCTVKDNCFEGTVSGSTNVGAIIGFYNSLNRYDVISGNIFTANCGSEQGIGSVKYVDTNCAAPTAVEGTTYFNTETSKVGAPGGATKTAHNRTDDPLGADAAKLCSIPTPDAEITITVSNQGILAADKNGEAMVGRTVTVKDIDKDGKLTVHEALLAAHEAYLTAADYEAADSAYGLSVTKLWGEATYNTLFFVNGVGLSVGVGTDTVKAGDALLASVNADNTYYADWYTAFDKASASVYEDDVLTLTLTGGQGMGYPSDFTHAAAGVQVGIWKNGAFEQLGSAVTDENGVCTLTFANAGTYIVTASGTVADMVDSDWNGTPDTNVNCPIIAPFCVVTVSEQPYIPPVQKPEIQVTFTLLGDTLHGEGGAVHTNRAGNLTAWLSAENYTLDEGAVVKDLLDAVEQRHSDVTFNGTASRYGTYIESVTFGTLTLAEFDNGALTGWMYTVNGTHPDVGVDAKALQNGDAVVFHYTDNYTREEGSESWTDPVPYTPPVSDDKKNEETKTETTVENGSISTEVQAVDGEAVVSLKTEDIVSAMEAIIADTDKDTLEIKPTVSSDADSVSVELPKEAFSKIAESDIPVSIVTEDATLNIPADALSSIAAMGDGDVKIEIKAVKPEMLADKVDAQLLENATVVEINITVGETGVSEFGGAELTLDIPVKSDNMKENSVYPVIAISDDGTVNYMVGKLVMKDGKPSLEVTTTHLTKFVVLEQETVEFTDVESGSWYESAVNWAVLKHITEGYGEKIFAPHISCTRAEMVTFLWRACGMPEAKADSCAFADVKADSYYREAVLWAVEQGITNGVDDTHFAPDAACTRGQMAVFLYRCAKAEASGSVNPFADVVANSYCYEAVLWAAENGITKGMTETTFAPAEYCTRGQMVTFLYRRFGK